MDREAWWATVLGIAKSWTQLSVFNTHTHIGSLVSAVKVHPSQSLPRWMGTHDQPPWPQLEEQARGLLAVSWPGVKALPFEDDGGELNRLLNSHGQFECLSAN